MAGGWQLSELVNVIPGVDQAMIRCLKKIPKLKEKTLNFFSAFIYIYGK